jgi:hypothetical protein
MSVAGAVDSAATGVVGGRGRRFGLAAGGEREQGEQQRGQRKVMEISVNSQWSGIASG